MNGLVDRYLVRLLFLKSASTEISQKYKVSSALDFFLQRLEKGMGYQMKDRRPVSPRAGGHEHKAKLADG